jgi:xylulokinase
MDAAPEVLLDASRRYLVTPHALPGWFGREMDLLATGTAHQWLRGIMGCAEEDIETLASGSPPGSRGLLFGPYLGDGEQGALWNPDLRGVIHGLSLRHRREDIARAFLEGLSYEIRRCVDVLGQSAEIDRVVLAGRPASSSFTTQLLADILGRPVTPVRNPSAAACGAALLARARFEDRCRPMGAMASTRPSADEAAYRALYRRYLGSFPMLAARSPDVG